MGSRNKRDKHPDTAPADEISGLKRSARWGLLTILGGLCLIAGWRIATGMMADRLALSDPERVLRLRPNHSAALLTLAQRDFADGQPQRSSLRNLLSVEPLEGKAFALIAAANKDPQPRVLELHRIAVRRAPRDTRSRVWLINYFLPRGRYGEALQQVDTLLRIAPTYREQLFPAMAQMARQPSFAHALERALLGRPAWRAGFLEMLPIQAEPATSSRVFAGLLRNGGLAPEEFDRWLALLIQQQRWDEAYSRWAGNLAPSRNTLLRAVYNGDFSSPPSGTGFDWRLLAISGVEMDFMRDETSGLIAHAYFPGRPAAKVNLEQPLLLAPGRYRLTARMRAQSLDGEYGLEWSVVCADRAQMLGNSERVRGSFGWRKIHSDFNVPATDCPGQWLQLLNPAPGGAAQRLSGDVWFDDVTIDRVGNSVDMEDVATLRIEPEAGMRSKGADFISVKSGVRMADGERLMLTRDSAAAIVYDNGCTQKYVRAGVYPIAHTSCATAYSSSATIRAAVPSTISPSSTRRLRFVPVITLLPEDTQPEPTPIGR